MIEEIFFRRLGEWVEQGQDTLEKRQEAQERILNCLCNHSIKLDLSNLGLTSLPTAISGFTDLAILSLDNNNFQEIPREIFALENLTYLSICDNALSEVGLEIVLLQNLQTLMLSNNQIREVADEISQIPNLSFIHLLNNELVSFPSQFFTEKVTNSSKSREVYLAKNCLDVDSIANLEKLAAAKKDKLTCADQKTGAYSVKRKANDKDDESEASDTISFDSNSYEHSEISSLEDLSDEQSNISSLSSSSRSLSSYSEYEEEDSFVTESEGESLPSVSSLSTDSFSIDSVVEERPQPQVRSNRPARRLNNRSRAKQNSCCVIN